MTEQSEPEQSNIDWAALVADAKSRRDRALEELEDATRDFNFWCAGLVALYPEIAAAELVPNVPAIRGEGLSYGERDRRK
jgi:hypothetical protein